MYLVRNSRARGGQEQGEKWNLKSERVNEWETWKKRCNFTVFLVCEEYCLFHSLCFCFLTFQTQSDIWIRIHTTFNSNSFFTSITFEPLHFILFLFPSSFLWNMIAQLMAHSTRALPSPSYSLTQDAKLASLNQDYLIPFPTFMLRIFLLHCLLWLKKANQSKRQSS